MTPAPTAGKILFVNGASSAGKSTLCAALQAALPEPFWHVSIDHLIAARSLPHDRIRSGEFRWKTLRPAFFDGFHRTLPALAGAGNNLIVEYIFETEAWRDDLIRLLSPFDVFSLGLHCPLAELERREKARGDRPIGDARRDFETTHALALYDLELSSTDPLEANVARTLSAWETRTHPCAFERMAADRVSGSAVVSASVGRSSTSGPP